MRFLLSFLFLCVLSFGRVYSQNRIDYKFGDGLRLQSKDTLVDLKFSARTQFRYQGIGQLESEKLEEYQDVFFIRRSRLKFDAGVFRGKVKFKFEYDLVGASVLDAVLKWNFYKNFTLWIGQTKLPGNRERVISSQKLQFVDRSQLNSRFTIDRDKGIQLRHNWSIGDFMVRESFAFSGGEGRNIKSLGEGHDYTGRIELLPFGKFTKSGDYVGADIIRETKPKLAIGVTFDYNRKAQREGGQLGDFLSETRDISGLFADFMFKYKGWSVMGEYAQKSIRSGGPLLLDTAGVITGTYYTGRAVNLQTGFVFNCNWEIAARYTMVVPEELTGNPKINEYTIGLSKYVVGHNLKVQSDITLSNQEGMGNILMFRLQTEFSL